MAHIPETLPTRVDMKVQACHLLLLSVVACSGPESASNTEVQDVSEDVSTPSDTLSGDAVAADTQAPVGPLCPPGRLFCISPRESGRCNATGDGVLDVTECTGATACEPSTGLCRTTICEPDKLECINLQDYQVCAFDGSGYGPVETCEAPLFCADGRCRACTENEVECLSETTYRRCAEDASAWSDTLNCPLDFRCTVAGEAGCKRCSLEKTCVSDTKARQRCTSGEVEWQEDTTCALGSTCKDGVCLACEANRTECLSETTYRACTSDGLAWSTPLTCGADEACLPIAAGSTEGRCLPYACSPRVLLLVDFSGSMSPHWESVRASVAAIVSANPDLRFGLKTFPDVDSWGCDVSPTLEIPFAEDNAGLFDAWFADNDPTGATPLADAMEVMRQNANAIFSELGGTIIVLSDGQDSCYWDSSGPPITFALATSTAGLYEQARVRTFAIGYSFGGDPGELNTISNNGGTGLRTHIPAGDEEELTDAFQDVIDKVKFCGPGGAP